MNTTKEEVNMTHPEMKRVIADLNSKTNEEIIAILETPAQTKERRDDKKEGNQWYGDQCFDSLFVLDFYEGGSEWEIIRQFIRDDSDEDGKNPGADNDDYVIAVDSDSQQILIQYKGG